jgi:hypothetical protein
MPLHDWSRVPAGLLHDFHQTWSIQIKLALNAGILPKGLSALVEQRSGPRESDVLAIERLTNPRSEFSKDGGVATAASPVTRFAGRTSMKQPGTPAPRISAWPSKPGLCRNWMPTDILRGSAFSRSVGVHQLHNLRPTLKISL